MKERIITSDEEDKIFKLFKSQTVFVAVFSGVIGFMLGASLSLIPLILYLRSLTTAN
jgi:hypothetical protein